MFQNGFSIFEFVPGLAHTFTIIANVRRTHHSPLPSPLARQNSQRYKEHTKCAYANVKSLHSLRYGKASHGNGNDRERSNCVLVMLLPFATNMLRHRALSHIQIENSTEIEVTWLSIHANASGRKRDRMK